MGAKTASELGVRLKVGELVMIRPDISDYVKKHHSKLLGGYSPKILEYQGKTATVVTFVHSGTTDGQKQDLYFLELEPKFERTYYWSSLLLIPVFTHENKATLKLK